MARSTDKKVLAQYLDSDPLVPLLLKYSRAQTQVTRYGRRFVKRIGEDGRLHSEYRQIGADSGRMSCAEPNIQQIPKEAAYRSCFVAPKGRVLVRADFNQLELRAS
jgi:DNA polymerase-1